MKIEKLTPEQSDALLKIKLERARRGREVEDDTDNAQVRRAERAIKDLYRVGGIPAPEGVIWVGSPLATVITGPTLAHRLGRGTVGLAQLLVQNIEVPLVHAMGEGLATSVRHHGQMEAQNNDPVWNSVERNVRRQISGYTSVPRDPGIRCGAGSDVLNTVKGQYHNYIGGHTWPLWGAAPAFFRDIVGLSTLTPQAREHLNIIEELVATVGWIWAHRDFVVACGRPTVLHVDAQGLLHNDKGASVGYPDGWEIWSWHGQDVAQRIIEQPETITLNEIDAESNSELRRVMIERYGIGRFLRDSGAQVVDTWTDEAGQPVRLLRREVVGDEPITMIHLINSTVDPGGTRREYWRRVPPTITSAKVARNWTCQLPEEAAFTIRS